MEDSFTKRMARAPTSAECAETTVFAYTQKIFERYEAAVVNMMESDDEKVVMQEKIRVEILRHVLDLTINLNPENS